MLKPSLKPLIAVKNYIVAHKEPLKTNALIITTSLCVISYGIIKGTARTRDMFLAEKGLTDEFTTWLTPEDE